MTSTVLSVTACARIALLSAGLALGAAAAAQASTFTWDFSGTIGTPQNAGGNDLVSNAPGSVPATQTGFVFDRAADGSSMTWGDPNTPAAGVPINYLGISSGGDSRDFAAGESADILIGWLDYTNKSVFHAGGIWYSTLSLAIELNSQMFNPDLRIQVDNTGDRTDGTNSASDLAINNLTGLNPDHITFLSLADLGIVSSISLGDGFWLDGFSLELLIAGDEGTREGTGTTGGVCSFAGAGSKFDTGSAKWSNCEGNESRLGLYLTIRYDGPPPPPPIPLPAAGWLLLGGLGALAAVRRRKRAA